MSIEKKVIYKNGIYFYECPNCRIMARKSGHTTCRRCHIGNQKFESELIRKRRSRNNRKKFRTKFSCEMGYYGCERRGYCNGDC